MSSPSREALTAGKRFSASVAALINNDIKPRRTPWRFSNCSLYLARISINGFMLTSLNVVSIAVSCGAASRRLATVLRKRVIGTRFSVRSPVDSATGRPLSDLIELSAFSVGFAMSVLVTRPPRPLPSTFLGSTPDSFAAFRTAGLWSL